MDLRLLKYFLKTAQELNISRAAALLHITQPTLSKELRNLEDELGVQLFIRTNKSVVLTAEGAYFQKKAKEITELSDKLEAEFKNGLEACCGDIYIGSGEAFSIKIIAGCIDRISRKYPHICFHLYSGDGDAIIDRLNKGLIDFAVLMENGKLQQYESLPIPFQERWGFYVHPDSELAEKKCVLPEDIRKVPLILPERPGLSRILSKWGGMEYDQLNVVARYNLMYNVSFLVQNRTACALGLDGLINHIEPPGLVFLPLQPAMTEQYSVYWKKTQNMKKISLLFLEELRKMGNEQN